MAITHSIVVSPTGAPSRVFRAESVSFTSSVGDQNSSRAVPSDRSWLLQTMRALNGEAGAKTLAFKLVDADGVTYAVLASASVAASSELFWYGDVLVPAGWTVRAYFLSMAGGSSCNWQYTAIEQ